MNVERCDKHQEIIRLHTYQLEQLEKANLARYDTIIEKLDVNFNKAIELEQRLIRHESHINELRERTSQLETIYKRITFTIIGAVLFELMNHFHLMF